MNAEERTDRIRAVRVGEEPAWRFDPPPASHLDEVEGVRTVREDPYARRRVAVAKLLDAIYLVFGIIIGLIAIRFVLKALGANPAADFAALIYQATSPLVAPFFGLFPVIRLDGSVIEPESIVAMIVYALVGWVLGRIVWLLLGEPRTGVATSRTEIDTRVR